MILANSWHNEEYWGVLLVEHDFILYLQLSGYSPSECVLGRYSQLVLVSLGQLGHGNLSASDEGRNGHPFVRATA